jgi:hypothetical protein
MLSPYTNQLLQLRYSKRWMEFIEPMSLGLARRVLTILAYARYLCPRKDPSASFDGKTVLLTWHWDTKMLTIRIPPCHENVFDEPMPGEELESITVTFMDGETGEFWIEEIQPGTATMHPVFPPRVEMAMMDLYRHTVHTPVQPPDKLYMSAFQFKRLFPDLPVSIELPKPEERSDSRGFRARVSSAVSEIKPMVLEAASSFGRALGRALFMEALSHWRNRKDAKA